VRSARRGQGSRPLLNSTPAFPITALDLRGWGLTEKAIARHGPASRAGRLQYSMGGLVIGDVTFRATIGKETGTVTLESDFHDELRPTVEAIELTSIPAHFGGRLWFFTCPATGQRARKLYRWPGMGFVHRTASPVPGVYACQRESAMQRTASAMARIRAKLGGWPGKVDRPADMDIGTWCRLCIRHAELYRRFWKLAGRGLLN